MGIVKDLYDYVEEAKRVSKVEKPLIYFRDWERAQEDISPKSELSETKQCDRNEDKCSA